MLDKRTVKPAALISLLLSWFVLSVCIAQDDISLADTQAARRAAPSLVYSMLQRHFYRPDIAASVKGLDADDQLRFLIDSGLDRWASYHINTSIDNNTAQQSVRDDFGLRLIKHNESYFLLPEIDGPNEQEKYVIYRVLKAPEDGDWKTAIANDSLSLAAPNKSVRFSRDEYVTTAFKLRGSELRIDNFTNNGIGFSIERSASRLPEIRVLDLRFNGGGRVDLADQLLQGMFNEPVQLGYSVTKNEKYYYGEVGKNIERNRFSGLTVLVSRHTASAAEWVARILQHYGATVVGERTEGKCLIHNVYPVGNRVYIKFATGYLKTAFESSYNYCNYGLVPNVFAYDIPLINEEAKTIASLADICANASNNTKPDDRCRQVFPGLISNAADTDTTEYPATNTEK